jgi:hypothetical protein
MWCRDCLKIRHSGIAVVNVSFSQGVRGEKDSINPGNTSRELRHGISVVRGFFFAPIRVIGAIRGLHLACSTIPQTYDNPRNQAAAHPFHHASSDNACDSDPCGGGRRRSWCGGFGAGLEATRRTGGVFAQWVHTHTLLPEDFNLLVATFHATFPQTRIWMSSQGDLIFVGTREPAGWDYAP